MDLQLWALGLCYDYLVFLLIIYYTIDDYILCLLLHYQACHAATSKNLIVPLPVV